MHFKITGGTTFGTQSLCDSCQHGTVIEGYRVSEKITSCRFLYPDSVIPFPVFKCSSYWKRDSFQMQLSPLYESTPALEVNPNRAGKSNRAGMAPEPKEEK